MFAVKMADGDVRYVSDLQPDEEYSDSLEFDYVPPQDGRNYQLFADFTNRTVQYLAADDPAPPAPDPITDLETMMVDMEYRLTLLKLEV